MATHIKIHHNLKSTYNTRSCDNDNSSLDIDPFNMLPDKSSSLQFNELSGVTPTELGLLQKLSLL